MSRAAITLLIIMVFIILPGGVAGDRHETGGHGDYDPKYARTPGELHEDRLSFGEKSHGALSQGWEISEFEVLSGGDAAGLRLLEGTGKRDEVETGLVYGERVFYHTHGKGLEVIILEFPDIETARDVYSGIFRKLGVVGFIASNEFGYEGYAAKVKSPTPETNGFRRGQFIVQVAGEEGASAYDVKMMCKVIDNDLKDVASKEGIVFEMDPFLRLEGRGLVLGSRLFEKKLIGVVAIGINFALIAIVGTAVAASFLWRRKRKKVPEPEIRVPVVPRTERVREFFSPVTRPPKEVKAVMAVILFLGYVLTVLLIDVGVQFFLTSSMTEHDPGSVLGRLYGAAEPVLDINMEGVTFRNTGLYLSKNAMVLILALVMLMGATGIALVFGLFLFIRRKGTPPSPPPARGTPATEGHEEKPASGILGRLKGKFKK
jgi:hypothetical protein